MIVRGGLIVGGPVITFALCWSPAQLADVVSACRITGWFETLTFRFPEMSFLGRFALLCGLFSMSLGC